MSSRPACRGDAQRTSGCTRGVEHHVRRPGDERVLGETGIEAGVGDDEGAGGVGLEPLALFVDTADQRDRDIADLGGQVGKVVERLFTRTIETLERGPRQSEPQGAW